MDKHILYSVLETLTAGNTVTINFHEPFLALSGDYNIIASKVGRGRGGSRVIEIAPIANPSQSFGALEIDGKEKALGTGTSEYINTIIVGDKTYGMEDPLETPRRPRVMRAPTADGEAPVPATKRQSATRTRVSSDTSQAQRVANAIGGILTDNPATNFRIIGKDRSSPMNGEWKVMSFTYADDALTMELANMDDASKSFQFDSTIHGVDVRDVQIIGIESIS